MNPPACVPVPSAGHYPQVELRTLQYDGDTLTLYMQGPGWAFVRVVFRDPVGFRLLDERELCEFWGRYHTGSGWLFEVRAGGWLELETHRLTFATTALFPTFREYPVVGNKCVSVLAVEPPELVGLGADPMGS